VAWPPETRFLDAAANGDEDALRALVAEGVPVDTADSYGEPALHLAARLEKPTAVKVLLDLGADITSRGPTGKTVVHYLAAYPKTLPLLEGVVSRGADVNDRDTHGQTPLMTAVLRGHVRGARALLALGADPLLRDDQDGTVVYHFVAGIYGFRAGEPHTEQLALLRELIARGVDPNAPGPYRKTAVTVAAEKGLSDVLDTLRDGGGSMSAPDAGGLTPLQTAAVHGHRREAMALLGASSAPLDFFSAVALGLEQQVMDFLAADRALARAVLAPLKTSALSLAIRFGHRVVVRLLLASGADPTAPDMWTSSLHSAIRHLPDTAVLQLLIERGANVHAIDGDMNTPLNFAVRDDRLELAALLLDAGAGPNAETERGYRPMQFARSEQMRALLRRHGGY
jgi:ankyrin repeat protein